MRKLNDVLVGVTHLAFDTAPLIYYIEANPRYDALMLDVFNRVDVGQLRGLCSVISLLEVLVVPIRNADVVLQKDYTDLLLSSANFTTQDISAEIAVRAAELRSQYTLRTPDAIQVATAIMNGCQAILTNDMTLKRISEIDVLVLDELTL